MKNKKVYRITLQYPETNNIDIREIVVDSNTTIFDSIEIAVREGLITNEEVNYITEVSDMTKDAVKNMGSNDTDIEHADSDTSLFQANQVVLTPKENYGTSKQFANLINDLHVTDEEYIIAFDNGNITDGEITILIYPNKFNDINGMAKYSINKVKSMLNLNSKKTVSVNYILNEDIEKFLELSEQNLGCCECDECEQKCCHDCDEECCDNHPEHPNNSCGNCNECVCESCEECYESEENEECDDCNEECSCRNNPDSECCESCNMTEDCGCYVNKTNCNESSENKTETKEPEKTLRIPVTPINPKAEIIMLAEAMAKRLSMITDSEGISKITISLEKESGKVIDAAVRVRSAFDVSWDLLSLHQ